MCSFNKYFNGTNLKIDKYLISRTLFVNKGI